VTNPYQAPPEADWQNSPGDLIASKGLGAKHYFLKLALMTGSVAFSGACFGGCFAVFLGDPATLFLGFIIGLFAAFIPSLVSCLLFVTIAALFSNYSEYRKNMFCGFASGALAGFVSVMVVTGGTNSFARTASVDSKALLLSALASAFGAGGGLFGAFLVNRSLRRNRLLGQKGSV